MIVTFRKAKSDEMESVLVLFKQAAFWLRDKGVDDWQNWITPPPLFTNWIQEGFDQEEFYIVESNGNVIGCFRLQWQDPLFWGEQEDNAGYVHSFTILRTLAGQNIGAQVLKLVEDFCLQNSKEFLRLDCGVNAVGLREYYEKNGYKRVGEVTVEGERLILYEKRIH